MRGGQHCLSKGEKLLPYVIGVGSRSLCLFQPVKVSRSQQMTRESVIFMRAATLTFSGCSQHRSHSFNPWSRRHWRGREAELE